MKLLSLNVKYDIQKSNIVFQKNINKNCYNICFKYFSMKKVYIICDSNVYCDYGLLISNNFKKQNIETYIFTLEVNEKMKNIFVVNDLYNKLIKLNFHKNDLIIGIGGGIILDISNFVANTYMRGINMCSIPTTLLAQVDASIGGKCGVNSKNYKNNIGCYFLTQLIIIDTNIIKKLPKKIFNDGISEVIKYGLISNMKIIEYLLNNKLNIENIIYQCVFIKKSIVEKDFFDKNIRLSLNYGHTFGHAIEAIKNYSIFSHGQSVALGMYYSIKLGIILHINNNDDLILLLNLFKKFSINYNYQINYEEIYLKIIGDKKIKDNLINFIFAKKGKFIIKQIQISNLKQLLQKIF